MASESADEVKASVGRRISELREARSWTQEAFAERAECSVKYVQSVERGDENLTIVTLTKFAWLLRVRVADLFAAPASRGPKKPGRPRSRRAS
jgi:transcriptional regulator with XRE-family HTH domain